MASAIVDAVEENSRQYMAFYNSLSPDKLRNCAGEAQYNLYILRLCAQLKKSALGVEEDKAFKHFDFFCSQFQNKGLAM